ncbi:hypothetical protein IWW36_000488 [Coemansia brasiliensis]|uniref:Small ribosomal subunit protein mS38 n=1 Tax=Coemansia brasiliensis TaxID=2650707 RepID=A0A9W8IH74_9FUNG|nr:hypothetical protein IWW36_000488 [Coemansia brasiliensis]
MKFVRFSFNSKLAKTAAKSSQSNLGAGRFYSVSSKRIPLVTTTTTRQQQQQQQKDIGSINSNKVPKFTVPQSEFLVANLFAQHRQLAGNFETSELDNNIKQEKRQQQQQERGSYKTISELLLCKGQTAAEAKIPHAKLKQIYAAPASVYMHTTVDSMIPEAKHLGPLAEPVLGKDMFADGVSTLNLDQSEVHDFVDDFFDSLVDRTLSNMSGQWSIRREQRETRMLRGSRWMSSELVDPVDQITGQNDYKMSSVLRKRKTKMNKHKHRKLRKKTRALRKRLGK